MNETVTPLNFGALVFVMLYLASMLIVGWVGYRHRKENTMSDFYLAGNGLGMFVLVLTLFATQYSANTLMGYTGKTYRVGFSWVMCTHFMTAIIVMYLLYAPKLYHLSCTQKFLTPVDFLNYRFGLKPLNVFASLLMIIAIANYLLGQLMAMGRAAEGLTGQSTLAVYLGGILFLAIIMVVYESLGGMRAVAWTDSIQGSILLVGFVMLMILVMRQYGTLEEATQTVMASTDMSMKEKVMPPDGNTIREWFSYIFLVGLGGALYPQAIQRIYSAKSSKILKRGLGVMAFMPLFSTLIAVLVGMYGVAYIAGLEGPESDQLLMLILLDIQESSIFGHCLMIVLISALLAAIMSTADSVLLSISSMFTKDIYLAYINRNASQSHLTKVGKRFSWLVVAALIFFAVLLKESTSLILLLDRKFDLLVQLSPAFFIGIHWKRMTGTAVFSGMLAGVAVSVGLAAMGYGKLFGIHAGLYGLAVNLILCIGISLSAQPTQQMNEAKA